MQTRPYPEKDGEAVWLNKSEQVQLLESVDVDMQRKLAFHLGLVGLRSGEIVEVTRSHVRPLGEHATLTVPRGKTGKREVPIPGELSRDIRTFANARDLRGSDELVDVGKRTLRNWITESRDVLDCPELGMHDLRRTWATDTFYTLGFNNVNMCEELTMSWGGWKQTQAGRQTFRENYLGPIPDHVAEQAAGILF